MTSFTPDQEKELQQLKAEALESVETVVAGLIWQRDCLSLALDEINEVATGFRQALTTPQKRFEWIESRIAKARYYAEQPSPALPGSVALPESPAVAR